MHQRPRSVALRSRSALAAAVVASAALALAATTGPAQAAPTGTDPAVTPKSAPTRQVSDTAARALVRDTGISAATAKSRVKGEAALATRSAKVDAALSPASSAGSWLDQKSGRLVVAVTTDVAAAQARKLGATPKKVSYSTTQLRTVQRALDSFAAGRGAGKVQSWGIDPATNTVTVRTTGAADARTSAFVAKARSYGAKTKLVTTTARMQAMADLVGGQQIEFTGYVCSNGFNARTSGGAARMLTAGHCGEGYSTFASGGTTIGTTTAYSFPGNDYAQAPISSAWTPRGVVDTYDGGYVAVKGSTAAAVGATICKSGRTTGWTCGTVQAKNQTVNYSNEDGSTSTVSGLTETSTCTEGGDSGGSNMSGSQAQGLTSGGAGYGTNGVCGEKVGQPNVSYIQPVNEALSAYGLTLVTE